MTITATRDKVRVTQRRVPRRQVPVWLLLVGVVAAWVLLWSLTRGSSTLYLPGLGRTGFHDYFTDLKADLIASRDTNVLMQVTGALSDFFNAVVGWLQKLISIPAFPRPVPEIGWLGVLGIVTWLTLAVAGWRLAVATTAGYLALGYLGYWNDSMDTLVIVFFSVAICLVIGIPVAVLMGNSRRATTIVTPILDVMQTLPSFVYLVPMVLFFAIGPAAAVAATVVFALPPVIRISGHGIRSVSPTTMEATDSLGQTRWQRLRWVQLPMAKRTIIVGVNQTIMAALSMVVIAAYVNGPGLGGPVLQSLQANQVGPAFVAGMCIVIVAVLLDRTTTVASERAEVVARGRGGSVRLRRLLLAVTGSIVLVMVYLSRTYSDFADFPESSIGPTVAEKVQSAVDWVTKNLSIQTTWIQDNITTFFINPLQDLLANSPWWLAGLALALVSLIVGGLRAFLTTVVCLAGIYVTDLWYDAMVTLTSVLVATFFVMVLAVILGVWMARSAPADRILRPVLDAAQVMPPFVYLIPVLGLFGTNRFTAIVAAIVFASPIAIKLVADGVKGVPPTTVEAATAAGSSHWQIITKVQLPMARTSLVLAANQGLLFVLSMVVIGGLVGGGALGYDVALGFSQGEYFGKGVAAGLAIVFLGIMIDRVANRAATGNRGLTAPEGLKETIRRYPRPQM